MPLSTHVHSQIGTMRHQSFHGCSGVARECGDAVRTGRHLLGAANGRKLCLKNSRVNSDGKFQMCLRAIKTKDHSQLVPTVGTVGYNIGSY